MGLIIVYCYLAGTSRGTAVMILASILGVDLITESTRLRSAAFNEKILRFWAPFMRAHEIHQMSTVPHYLASVILAIGIFPKPVAVLSILYLACGDPIASLAGILYGNRGPRLACGKTLIGTSAGIVVCALLTFVYLKSLAVADSSVWILTVVGGLAGGMAELLPFEVDDNFTIPVISGFVLWLAFMLVGV
jgi:dolichol kinase